MIEDGPSPTFSFEPAPATDKPLEETMASTKAECVKLTDRVNEVHHALETTRTELAHAQEQLDSSRKAQETATVDHRVALAAAKREVDFDTPPVYLQTHQYMASTTGTVCLPFVLSMPKSRRGGHPTITFCSGRGRCAL
ncbi:hypothetical protein BJX70DRAFT_194551 [Aspergillus crustosus]